MTLIGFYAQPDRVDLVTDTLGYTAGYRELFTEAKWLGLPAIRAVVACQGKDALREQWQETAAALAAQSADFDEFTAAAEVALPAAWQGLLAQAVDEGRDAGRMRSAVFHLGWSPQVGRFVAYAYSSDEGWARHDLTDVPYVMPAPLGIRPGHVERAIIVDEYARMSDTRPETAPTLAKLLDDLDACPPLPPPPSPDAWDEVATEVRRTRSLIDVDTCLKTVIGGQVIHVALTLDGIRDRVLLEFDDSGDELAQLVDKTLHSVSQRGPCPYHPASGRSFLACCLVDVMDDPCPCGTGLPLLICCAVAVPMTYGR